MPQESNRSLPRAHPYRMKFFDDDLLSFFPEVVSMTNEDGKELHILDVGQCSLDHRTISAFFADRFKAKVTRAHGQRDAQQALMDSPFNLVLVNRLLDRDGSSGLELIRTLKQDPRPELSSVPVMLVSNHPEAQQAATEIGAEPGFGKAHLRSEETLARLKAVLER